MLQIDPREDFTPYLDEKIFIQQLYDEFGTSDARVESEGIEEKEKEQQQAEEEKGKEQQADAEEEKAADAEEEEEKKEGGELEEQKEDFGDSIITSEVGKFASNLQKISGFGEAEANDLCASSNEEDKCSATTPKSVSFREVVHLLRQQMENNMTTKAEMSYQVKYFANMPFNAE